MLSSTFHVHAALKLAPILPQKSQEIQVVHDLQLYRKTSTVSLIFFMRKKRRKLYHTLLGYGRQGKASIA